MKIDAGVVEAVQAASEKAAWKKISIRRHFHYHWIGAAALIALYLLLHFLLEDRYRSSAKPPIEDAIRRYQILEDSETHEYALFFGSQRIDTADDSQASNLGLGKLQATVGFLTEAKRVVQQANQDLRTTIGDVLGRFTDRKAGPGTAIRDTNIYIAAADRFEPSLSDWFLRVSLPDGTSPANLPRNLEGLRLLHQVIQNGVCEHRTKRVQLNPPPALPERVRERTPKLDSRLGRVDNSTPGADGDEARVAFAKLVMTFGKDQERIAKRITEFFRPEKAQPSADQNATENRWIYWTTCFHTRLTQILQNEIGFFWVFGTWKWWEILLLACLGVMVEVLVRLGLLMTGRAGDVIWEPNETWRTCLKLLYAPFTALIALWTLITTDVLELQLANEAAGTLLITLAFLFGLFPNLTFSLFKRLAEAIFQRTTVAEPPKRGQPRTVQVSSAPSVEDGQPPNFEEFKAALRRHATAPLRNDV